MIAYSYDKVTGELLGEEEADESPLCPGEFLVPAFSTLTPPPEAEDRKKAVYKDGSWALVDDYRGFKFWDNRGRSFIISELGVAPPKNVLLSRPGRCLPVRMNKFRKALLLFGLLDKVQLEIANIEDPFIRQCAEVDWEYGVDDISEWDWLYDIFHKLGIDDAKMDSIFETAHRL